MSDWRYEDKTPEMVQALATLGEAYGRYADSLPSITALLERREELNQKRHDCLEAAYDLVFKKEGGKR